MGFSVPHHIAPIFQVLLAVPLTLLQITPTSIMVTSNQAVMNSGAVVMAALWVSFECCDAAMLESAHHV